MGIKIGSTDINKLYTGNTETSSIIIGTDPVILPNYLCFTAEEANSSVELCYMWANDLPIANTAYSRDRLTWTTFTPVNIETEAGGANKVVLTNIGDKVYFRNDIIDEYKDGALHFSMTGKIASSGNIMSLYSSTNFNNITALEYEACFYALFGYGNFCCTALTSTPELPATTLSTQCYKYMFCGCTSLTSVPELPAATLAYQCYQFMFMNCTSLATAPELPGNTLAEFCYAGMFRGCTVLTDVPELPATTLARGCYQYMFQGCTSLTASPELPATTLAQSCYSYMFDSCTLLTTAPELPATTLTANCYGNMFYGCTSLQVSDTQTTEASQTWIIPGTMKPFTNETTYDQFSMFRSCLGTRYSDNMTGAKGDIHVYYTQNEPI